MHLRLDTIMVGKYGPVIGCVAGPLGTSWPGFLVSARTRRYLVTAAALSAAPVPVRQC
jgi:hypothetical protein